MPVHLQSILRKIYGNPAWGVRKGYGSSITFEFGKPKLEVRRRLIRPNQKAGIRHRQRLARVYGDWHLWIFCCNWEIRQDGRKLCHSESQDKKIERACSILNGQILTKVSVNSDAAISVFCFDLGGCLQTTPYRGVPLEMWSLRCPNNRYFAFRADGQYSYSSGNTAPNLKRWLRFIA